LGFAANAASALTVIVVRYEIALSISFDSAPSLVVPPFMGAMSLTCPHEWGHYEHGAL